MDDANGIKDVNTKKYKGKSYTGNNIKYKVGGDIFISDGSESNRHDEEKEDEVKRAGDRVGREYGLKNPDKILEVEWEAEQQEDEEFNRKAALDALYTWRNKVLPDLPDGLMLANKPAAGGRGGDVRAKIYQMAGFTPALESYDDYQFGMVVTDENGVKRVVPVDPDGDTMKESYGVESITNMLIDNINLNDYDNYNTIYEGLFL